jgi:hypothetical protein
MTPLDRLERLEALVEHLVVNRQRDAFNVAKLGKLLDTIQSPMWKRVTFIIKGYRWRQLGVWYYASWNRDAWGYETKPHLFRRIWNLVTRHDN